MRLRPRATEAIQSNSRHASAFNIKADRAERPDVTALSPSGAGDRGAVDAARYGGDSGEQSVSSDSLDVQSDHTNRPNLAVQARDGAPQSRVAVGSLGSAHSDTAPSTDSDSDRGDGRVVERPLTARAGDALQFPFDSATPQPGAMDRLVPGFSEAEKRAMADPNVTVRITAGASRAATPCTTGISPRGEPRASQTSFVSTVSRPASSLRPWANMEQPPQASQTVSTTRVTGRRGLTFSAGVGTSRSPRMAIVQTSPTDPSRREIRRTAEIIMCATRGAAHQPRKAASVGSSGSAAALPRLATERVELTSGKIRRQRGKGRPQRCGQIEVKSLRKTRNGLMTVCFPRLARAR